MTASQVAGVIVMVVVVLAAVAAAWWCAPSFKEDFVAAQARRRIDQIRKRSLAEMELTRELGWRERDARSRDQLRGVMDRYDL